MRTRTLTSPPIPSSRSGRTEPIRGALRAPVLAWKGRRTPLIHQASEAGPATGSRLARFIALEALIWAACYGLYLSVRGFSIGSQSEAMRHAGDVVDLERTVGIFHEASIQSTLSPVVDFFSTYYMVGFGPLLALMLVWLARRDPVLYREMRTALLASLAFATVIFILFPTAPPRLVDGLGISDTVGLSGHDNGSFMGIRFNPYAAVPSMHVGWSLLAGIYGYRTARTQAMRAFFAIHPAVMTVTVVATGNHYIVDALAGIVVVGAALILLARRPERAPRRRPATPAALRPAYAGAALSGIATQNLPRRVRRAAHPGATPIGSRSSRSPRGCPRNPLGRSDHARR